ncbi:hypothetical protein ACXN5S_17135 [Pseudoroseicyclus sp. H15]
MRPAIFAALTLATLPLAGPALAANCAPHEDVVGRLAERYGESRQSIALGANNAVVEVFASLETGTWTLTMTRPGGLTCLIAAGVAYEVLAEPLPVGDEPA